MRAPPARAVPAQQQKEASAAVERFERDLQTKIRQGYVERGWQPRGWAARLRQLADRCEAMHPDRAAELRQWADNVDRRPRAPATRTEGGR
jgi:hypothetical protein